MEIEPHFVKNYVYSQETPLRGGMLVSELFGEPIDARFENLAVPVGLSITHPGFFGGSRKRADDSPVDLISDEMFDRLFDLVSIKPPANKTRKNLRHMGATTKKSQSTR